MLNQLTQETLDMIKSLQAAPLAKAVNQATGLVQYDLSPYAKGLYPVITPLRNMIPRVAGAGDTATRWKAITAINTGNTSAGVSEGNRGGNVDFTVANYTAAYKGIGLENSVTFEAEYAAVGFDNARARAVEALLRSVMIQEERIILDGNASLALGVTPTPTAILVAGGSLTAQADNVYCVALSADGFRRSTIAGGLPGQITRTNTDASTDSFGGGNAQVSAASNTVTTAGGNLSVSASVAPVRGAAGYAWYIGNTAATALLAAITTINSVLITANPTGTQAANDAKLSADRSTNALIFDGILTQSNIGGSGYYTSLATGTNGTGSGLTATGDGGIVEIDAALKSFWDVSRLSPSKMIVNAQELVNITKKILVNGATPLMRFNFDPKTANQGIIGGTVVGGYLNRFQMGSHPVVEIMLHPDQVPGTITFVTENLPYPTTDIPGVYQMKARKDYYQIEWPLRTRKYEFGVYADEVLQVFAPFAFGCIQNIANV